MLHVPRLASGRGVPAHGVLIVGAQSAHFVSLAAAGAAAAAALRAAAGGAGDGGGGGGARGAAPPPLHPVPLLPSSLRRDVVGGGAWAECTAARAPLLLWTVGLGAAAGVVAEGSGGGGGGGSSGWEAAPAPAPTVGDEQLGLYSLQSAAVGSQAFAQPFGEDVRTCGELGAARCALDALPVPSLLEALDEVAGEAAAKEAEAEAEVALFRDEDRPSEANARVETRMRARLALVEKAVHHANACRRLAHYGDQRAAALGRLIEELKGGGGGGAPPLSLLQLQHRRKEKAAQFAELKNRLHTAHFLLALRRAAEEDKRRQAAEAAAEAAKGTAPAIAPAHKPAWAAATYKEELAFQQLGSMRDAVRRQREGWEAKAEAAKQLWNSLREEAPEGGAAPHAREDQAAERALAELQEKVHRTKLLREHAAAAVHDRAAAIAALHGRSSSTHYH